MRKNITIMMIGALVSLICVSAAAQTQQDVFNLQKTVQCTKPDFMERYFSEPGKFIRYQSMDGFQADEGGNSSTLATYIEDDATIYLVETITSAAGRKVSCVLFVGKNLRFHDPRKQQQEQQKMLPRNQRHAL